MKYDLFELLLVQMVYDGNRDFGSISTSLNQHPLLKKEKVPKTTKAECERIFEELIANHELYDNVVVRKKNPKVDPNLEKLAQALYMAVVSNLIAKMQDTKQDFTRVVQELDTMQQANGDENNSSSTVNR